jgi:VWFA-related protein
MRSRLFLLILAPAAFAAFPAFAQQDAKAPFHIQFDRDRDVVEERAADGKGLRFTVKFLVVRNGKSTDSGKDYKVIIKEDGKEVRRLDMPEPKVTGLSAVLAVDISGTKDRTTGQKNAQRRVDKSREAAEVFLKKLPDDAECGLLLFDDKVDPNELIAPTRHRAALHKLIAKMEPRGGTAYLDAARKAIATLADSKIDGKRVLVIMTDGVDLQSKAKLPEVIDYAKKKKVNIYTIGMGEPGKLEPVTSVLVFDRSASMEEPADDSKNERSKIKAARGAATSFVEALPPKASTTILSFGSELDPAIDFTDKKDLLKQAIDKIETKGETRMLDAAYEAISMLAAENRPGKKAIVVMTDGIDNVSRLRPEDVVAKARAAGVTVHMLLFGKEKDLAQAVPDMTMIAKETGGTFNMAKNEEALLRLFKDMSIVLHDDGIDEPSLKRLAKETGGAYYPARDISKLQLVTGQISEDIRPKPYVETFNSLTGFDGSVHVITLELVKLVHTADGQQPQMEVVQKVKGDVAVRGVVVAEMHPVLYLGLLLVLVGMAAVPSALGRMFRKAA